LGEVELARENLLAETTRLPFRFAAEDEDDDEEAVVFVFESPGIVAPLGPAALSSSSSLTRAAFRSARKTDSTMWRCCWAEGRAVETRQRHTTYPRKQRHETLDEKQEDKKKKRNKIINR